MREIIHIQIGQCGNQIGGRFWKDVMDEHGINSAGNYVPHDSAVPLDQQCLDVYFNELDDHRRVPRAILVDMEPSTIETLRTDPLGALYNSENILFSYSGAGNNWAKGYYTLGAEMLERTLESIRHEAEQCECVQGIQVVHSLGGGTGSGFGALILSKLREEFSDRILASFSIFPSANISNTVVEPYNAVLAISALIENVDAVHVIDNEALGHITRNILKVSNPTFDDFNKLVSQAMTGTTCSLRFPGQLNSDLRKLCVNLTPFPRLHFFSSTTSPLKNRNITGHAGLTVSKVTSELFNRTNLLCRRGESTGRYLAASAVYRGSVSTKEVDDELSRFQIKESHNFVEWIPNNIKSCVCNVPPVGLKLSATFLGNSTGVQELFLNIRSQFSAMIKRRAFLHWYTNEGLDEIEMIDAANNLYDLAREYEQYESSDFASTDNTLAGNSDEFDSQ